MRVRSLFITGAVLAASCLIPTAAGAESVAGDWVANARASAVDMGAVTTGGFIVDRVDPSAALATSQIETGSQVATSLASAPYPSEIGQQLPGLVFGILQNTLPYNGIPVPALGTAPTWPWTIRSSANGSDPPSASSGGETSPMWLKTKSEERTTGAFAATGGSAPGAFSIFRMTATSNADASQAGKAVVTAVSTIDNLAIGDVLKIGKLRTELNITQVTGGKPEVGVKRDIVGLSVNGTDYKMDADGPPQPMVDALKAAGIELRVGETKDASGKVSASGMVIRRPFDFSQMSGGNLPLSVPKTMVFEMAFGVVSGNITDLAGGATVAPAMQLAAATAPAGTAPGEKEMGVLGWVAQLATITVVLGLVIRRGRRVVGGA